MRPPAFATAGQFYRGSLHTHSNRSDGVESPEHVLAEYRAAGYDFVVLTDHFEERRGWTVTDTSAARDSSFTTLLGVELSSADWDDEDVYWVNAIGVPADFAPPTSSMPWRPTTTTARWCGRTRERPATPWTRCWLAGTGSM